MLWVLSAKTLGQYSFIIPSLHVNLPYIHNQLGVKAMSWFAACQIFKVVRMTRELVFMSLMLVFLVSTGCVMLPLPTSPKTVAGTEVQEEPTTFIQPGLTTREEIEWRLGEPDWEFDDIGIIAYKWIKHEWNIFWVAAGGAGGVLESGKNYILFFLFDIDQKVTAHEIVNQSWWFTTVRETARNWAEKQGVSLPHCAKGFICPSIPKDRSVICVYRESSFFGDNPVLLPLIRLDGKNVVELGKKHYIFLDGSPGTHEISVDPDPNPFSLSRRDRRPVRNITVNTLSSKASYIEVRITYGMGKTEPILTVRPEAEVVEKLRDFRPVP